MRKFRVQGRTAWWLQIALLAASLTISQQLPAMTFTVDDNSDAVDANPGDGLCATSTNTCTLRAAVQESNAWAGADVIRLQPGTTYTLTLHGKNENKAATGDLDILDDVTISGGGDSEDPNSADYANATIIDGDSADRVLDILNPAANVFLYGVIIKHGQLSGSNVTGAGINNVGVLHINDSAITSNSFGQLQGGGGGGGIAISNGKLIINHSQISGNRASGFAGINVAQGDVDITDSSIVGNTSQGSGGGIGINNGTVKIINSTISLNSGGNPGGEGGGINNAGHLFLIGSTVDGNSGVAQGGGIANVGTGTIDIVNSSIINNTAEQGNGGGILAASNTNGTGGSSTVSLANTTIAGNIVKGFENNQDSHIGYGGGLFYAGARVTLRDTVIADNANAQPNLNQGDNCSAGEGAPASANFGNGTLQSDGYNISGDTSCPLSGAGDQIKPATPMFAGGVSLAYNGGPTKTVALQSSSPAKDHGNPAGCTDNSGTTLKTDQRGYPRPDGVSGVCDVGAFEAQQSSATLADLGVHLVAAPSPVDPGTLLTYTATVTNHGASNATGVAVTDVLPAGTTLDSGSGCTVTNTSGAGVETIQCNVGSLSAGSSTAVIFKAKVKATATGTLTDHASVNGNETDLNPANDSDSIDTKVNLSADLNVTATSSPNPAVLNLGSNTVTYTVTVSYPATGAGTATVPGVKFIDKLPPNANLVGGSTTLDGSNAAGTGGPCVENAGAKTITCDLGPSPDHTMSPGQSHTLTFQVKPTVAGTITNVAAVNFNGTDPAPTNNRVSTDTSVEVHADLALTITDNPDPVLVNNDLVYILNVINNGPSPSSDVSVQATLPSNVTYNFANSSRGTSTCSNASGTVTCDLAAMGAGSQATVTIFVTPTATGHLQLTGSASVASGETDPNPANNSASAGTDVQQGTGSQARADLSIGLSTSPNKVFVGDTLNYTLTVTNNTGQTSDDAGDVIAVLTLPASVTVTSPSSACSSGSAPNVVSCQLGTIAAGKSAQATVGVTPSQTGILTANASVNFVGTDPVKSNNTTATSVNVQAAPAQGSGKSGALGLASLWALALLYGARLRRRR